MDRVTNICTHVKKIFSSLSSYLFVYACVLVPLPLGECVRELCIYIVHCTCGCGYTALMEIMCYGVLYTVLIQGSGDEQNMVGVCVYKVQ